MEYMDETTLAHKHTSPWLIALDVYKRQNRPSAPLSGIWKLPRPISLPRTSIMMTPLCRSLSLIHILQPHSGCCFAQCLDQP